MEIKEQGNKKELMKMIKWNEKENCMSLQLAIHLNRSKKVIFKIINIGGKELVVKTNNYRYTALHRTCMNSDYVSVDVISKLLEVGGRELLTTSVLKSALNRKKIFSGCCLQVTQGGWEGTGERICLWWTI